jgi:hypothetical protein
LGKRRGRIGKENMGEEGEGKGDRRGKKRGRRVRLIKNGIVERVEGRVRRIGGEQR